MTISLGTIEELEEKKISTKIYDDEPTFVTNIHEDDEDNDDNSHSTNEQKRFKL